MEHQRQSVDWTGRILSIASLIVAVGIGAYVVTQSEVSGTREELLSEFDQELQGMIKVHEEKRNALEKKFSDSLDKNDERMTAWNNQLVAALNDFDRDAKRLREGIAEDETTARENRLADFQKELIELRRLAVTDPSDASTTDDGSNETDSDSPDANQFAVHTVLKVIPPDTQEEALIQIENDTKEDALIQRIQFKPESDFRVDTSDTTATDFSGIDSILVFPFDSTHNTSTKSGHHGLYDRKLSNPIRIRAGETMTLRVVINGQDHVGWGFAGQLRLVYNSDEPLLIKTARVHFEAPEDDVDDTNDLNLDDLINST